MQPAGCVCVYECINGMQGSLSCAMSHVSVASCLNVMPSEMTFKGWLNKI